MELVWKKINFLLVDNKSRFWLLVFLTPVFWWTLFHINEVFNEWQKTPSYFDKKINSIFSKERLSYVLDLRWSSNLGRSNYFLPRNFYNKFTVLIDEPFGYLTFISPRFYFQAGDGGRLSPPGIEPIPVILFPFWVFGIFFLIKEKRKLPFLFLFLKN